MTSAFDATSMRYIIICIRLNSERVFGGSQFLMIVIIRHRGIALSRALRGGIGLRVVRNLRTLQVAIISITKKEREVVRGRVAVAEVHRRYSRHVVVVVPRTVSYSATIFRTALRIMIEGKSTLWVSNAMNGASIVEPRYEFIKGTTRSAERFKNGNVQAYGICRKLVGVWDGDSRGLAMISDRIGATETTPNAVKRTVSKHLHCDQEQADGDRCTHPAGARSGAWLTNESESMLPESHTASGIKGRMP
jgi:hypothetical protein